MIRLLAILALLPLLAIAQEDAADQSGQKRFRHEIVCFTNEAGVVMYRTGQVEWLDPRHAIDALESADIQRRMRMKPVEFHP